MNAHVDQLEDLARSAAEEALQRAKVTAERVKSSAVDTDAVHRAVRKADKVRHTAADKLASAAERIESAAGHIEPPKRTGRSRRRIFLLALIGVGGVLAVFASRRRHATTDAMHEADVDQHAETDSGASTRVA
jgi:hypothetical protein